MKDYRVHEPKLIHDARWLKLFQLAYEHSGRTFSWIFASRKEDPFASPEVDAVMIAVRVLGDDGRWRTLITRELRPALWDGVDAVEYSFPAGLKEPGESIEECARRELYEETGMTLAEVDVVSPRLYSSAGLTNECTAMLIGKATGKPSLHAQEISENIEVLLLDQEELRSLVNDTSIKWSGKAWPVAWLFVQTSLASLAGS